MFVKYTTKHGPIGIDYYDAVEEGIKLFLCKCKDNVYMAISDDEPRGSKCGIEACYLCHGIWTKIMKNNRKPFTGNYFTWVSAEMEELVFHFDIMNNPKEKNKKYSCGLFKECNDELRKDVNDIYHSIGNMAPIPWFRLTGGSYIDGQTLHKSLDERWDMFLQLLKNNWSFWNTNQNGITFERYMIMTCQQVYFEEIYEEVIKIENITIDDIKRWNRKINSDSKIISFTPGKNENVADIIKKIIKIIRVRCEIINIMLNEASDS